jgi:hypothetical protein
MKLNLCIFDTLYKILTLFSALFLRQKFAQFEKENSRNYFISAPISKIFFVICASLRGKI